ncbi:hypothetical protein ACJA88_000788 [Fusarium oxysporum]
MKFSLFAVALSTLAAASPTPDMEHEKRVLGLLKPKGGIPFTFTSIWEVLATPDQSPANTATHIHEAVKGKSGPPRIAFPNPVGDEKSRNAVGCLQGPFRTGVIQNGQDTGVGFTLEQIEKNPEKFFADSHSSLAVPGAFRGQLSSGKVC